MKSKLDFIVVSINFILVALSAGCFAPINSTFESAKLLDKGEIELQGNYSKYYFEEETTLGLAISNNNYGRNSNNNYGLGIGFGISDQFNLKFRYERMIVNEDIKFFADEQYGGFTFKDGFHYFELGSKFQITPDKIAVSIPLGIYLAEKESIFSLDPRFFFTVIGKEKFEINVIPKFHVSFFTGDDGYILVIPGIILGLGLSNNLDKWAIRPEMGWDGYITFGIGLNYYIKPGNGE